MIAYCSYYGVKTRLWTEAKAVLDGLEIARGNSLNQLWIELDSQLLVDMLQGRCSVPWNLACILRKIISLLLARYYISHIFREGNRGADLLAK